MKKRVLVVDDEQDIIDFLETFLTRFNVSVIKASGGVEAIDSYQKYKPDSVLLDIQLPDKDGITVLRELKKQTPKLKVIMITGKEEKEYQAKAKKYGAIDYITKPLDLIELSEKIKEHIL